MEGLSNLPSRSVFAMSFISRVFTNETVRKGLLGAAATLLVGGVAEAVWPSEE
jgi:hypothetical protein